MLADSPCFCQRFLLYKIRKVLFSQGRGLGVAFMHTREQAVNASPRTLCLAGSKHIPAPGCLLQTQRVVLLGYNLI